MGRIQAPVYKLQAPEKKPRKPKEYKFKAWKPLPGQLYFPELERNASVPKEVHVE